MKFTQHLRTRLAATKDRLRMGIHWLLGSTSIQVNSVGKFHGEFLYKARWIMGISFLGRFSGAFATRKRGDLKLRCVLGVGWWLWWRSGAVRGREDRTLEEVEGSGNLVVSVWSPIPSHGWKTPWFKPYDVRIWRFPEIGVPPNHPF